MGSSALEAAWAHSPARPGDLAWSRRRLSSRRLHDITLGEAPLAWLKRTRGQGRAWPRLSVGAVVMVLARVGRTPRDGIPWLKRTWPVQAPRISQGAGMPQAMGQAMGSQWATGAAAVTGGRDAPGALFLTRGRSGLQSPGGGMSAFASAPLRFGVVEASSRQPSLARHHARGGALGVAKTDKGPGGGMA